jgi:hypothetical protein
VSGCREQGTGHREHEDTSRAQNRKLLSPLREPFQPWCEIPTNPPVAENHRFSRKPPCTPLFAISPESSYPIESKVTSRLAREVRFGMLVAFWKVGV